MARLPRLKVENGVGWYHICARVAGGLKWFPFEDPAARNQLLRTIQKYLSVYFCQTAGFCIMGNHYHLILRFDAFRPLSRSQLQQRAQLLYRDPDRTLSSLQQWQRFNRRLFDLSEFMRNVQQTYTKWYNRNYGRRGSLWAGRFKSLILEDPQSILDTLLYVELNPVRAGLVQQPEHWAYSSASLRSLMQDQWLIPLSEVLPNTSDPDPWREYRALLYYRGGVSTKPTASRIPTAIVQLEQARGFPRPGAYRKRLRYFTDALVIGTRLQVQKHVSELRRRGYYLRRRFPILQRVDLQEVYTLREQRTLWVPPETVSPVRSTRFMRQVTS